MAELNRIIELLTDMGGILAVRQEICPREELQYWIEMQEGVAEAIELLKEHNTVEHAKEVLCRNGWEKARYQEGTICKWDDPEVVRCKDCVHYHPGFCCDLMQKPIMTDAEWYCADGKRRSEDG